MARPKLNEDERKVSVSFAIHPFYKDMLNAEIPPGNRSEWIAGVVIAALQKLNDLSNSDLV